ncbi:putative nucleic acid-binding protein, contains PIN domain [Methanophagales archaeon]|nr:putative nucleic acid-binding protein, contains PIN domain [Methanophagales archaeon]
MLIVDTDIASAFAKSGHFDALIKLFESVGITPTVYEELLTPLEHGYEYPKEIFEKAELVTISDDEQREYLRLNEEHAKIGKGEIESIVVCLKRCFLFSSFDKKAILVARDLGVDVITAGVIFKGLMVKSIAKKEEIPKMIGDIEISDNRVLEVEL